MKTKIQIKSIIGDLLFEFQSEGNTNKETVTEFLKANAGKVIRGADLSGMDLSGVSFDNSRFDNSSFYNSRFDNSSFYNSRFDNSSFDNSSFDKETAKSALESGALESIKNDLFGRMLRQKHEVPFLKRSLVDGKINGSSYEGECACFVGTMAKGANVKYDCLPNLKPDADSPTEKWFFSIKEGDTPDNSVMAKITYDWIVEFESFVNQ